MKHAGTLVVADDVAANLALLTRLLTAEGYTVLGAADGEAALALVRDKRPDMVLLDVMMPKLTGFDVCRRIKEERSTRLIPVVLITTLGKVEDRIEGINAGADDFLTKPVNAQELQARVRSAIRLKRYTDDLDSAESVILSLGLTVEARDPYTLGHCERMAAYAAALGVHIDLPDEDIAALHRGGYLHDVGKVGVPDSVLLKPGRLTPDEEVLMQAHPVIGESLCGDLRLLRPVKGLIRHHHERLDGTGYPDRLRGDAIPLLAQIAAIVDVYDALTSDRVYRPAMSRDAACAELKEEVHRGWRSPTLVGKFLAMLHSGRLDKLVEAHAGPMPLSAG
jgi:putative two-component system response regulator